VKKFSKRLRLLPAVIVLGSGLLVLKGTDITLEARAESAAPVQATPAPAPMVASNDPAADDSAPASVAEVDVLTSLAKRRNELDAREQDLAMRANLIAAAEGRVDGKITQLKQLETQVQALLGQRDDAETKEIASLVKTYASMKPKDAARIFNSLNEDVLLEVAAQMKPDVLGAIMAGMQPDQAQKLTVRLANRLKLPDPPPAPAAPALLAANLPAATTPAGAPQAAPLAQTNAPLPATPAPINAPAPKATPQAASPAAAAPTTTAPATAAKTTPASSGAAPAGK
jgi:flagellar motility protein MotE (MotC chaperone)